MVWLPLETGAGVPDGRQLPGRLIHIFRITPSFCRPEMLQIAVILKQTWKFSPPESQTAKWSGELAWHS